MWTAVGLALDVVGAVLILRGLFRHPRPLYPGWLYMPPEAAKDRAYGVTGGGLLIVGFAGQFVGNAGIGACASGCQTCSTASVVGVGALALVVGAFAAYFLYGASFMFWMRRIRTREISQTMDWAWTHKARWPRFWNYDPLTR